MCTTAMGWYASDAMLMGIIKEHLYWVKMLSDVSTWFTGKGMAGKFQHAYACARVCTFLCLMVSIGNPTLVLP
jgi:hypothetical protein